MRASLMSHALLIASGAYVEPELDAEFGRLPPSFLPLGNRRLFVHQRAAAGDAFDTIIMSLPEDFEIGVVDHQLVQKLGIDVVRVPPGLTLGNSIVYVINLKALSRSSFSVLHGDTLITGLSSIAEDSVSATEGPASYQWGLIKERNGFLEAAGSSGQGLFSNLVLSGFFRFSEASLLVQTITRRNGDFLGGLTDYSAHRPLRLIKDLAWLDFGHANTYYQSRRSVSTERAFNRLSASRRFVVKSGADSRKIDAEANWFERIPNELRLFTPAYLGRRETDGEVGYAVEYLNQSTLADLFVFGRLSLRSWERIFLACDEFLQMCRRFRPDMPAHAPSKSLYLDKTLDRLEEFARMRDVDLQEPCRLNGAWLPPLERMAKLAAERIPEPDYSLISLIHGDFCFSNILYDFRSEMITVVDPRGLDADGRSTVYGDARYDLGKLYHSVVGRYDHILAGYFSLGTNAKLDLIFDVPTNGYIAAAEAAFRGQQFGGLSVDEGAAAAIATLLFLAMLPLHSDDPDRQVALLANAMRLFLDLDKTASLRTLV
jgi:hypothetical protein